MSLLVERLPTLFTALLRSVRKAMVRAVTLLGLLALAMLVLAFTRVPYDVHRWLGEAGGSCRLGTPALIVVLGGSGMPSGPELLRLHHAAELATVHPSATLVLLHPSDTAVMDLMVAELTMRGIEGQRILREYKGTNTREQALALAQRGDVDLDAYCALVTAPENMYRSLGALRKAGFREVCGAPAWDDPMFIDLDYDHRRVGGKAFVPDVSGNNALRYDLWNRLKLQITCMREFLAIAYYRLNGWL